MVFCLIGVLYSRAGGLRDHLKHHSASPPTTRDNYNPHPQPTSAADGGHTQPSRHPSILPPTACELYKRDPSHACCVLCRQRGKREGGGAVPRTIQDRQVSTPRNLTKQRTRRRTKVAQTKKKKHETKQKRRRWARKLPETRTEKTRAHESAVWNHGSCCVLTGGGALEAARDSAKRTEIEGGGRGTQEIEREKKAEEGNS